MSFTKILFSLLILFALQWSAYAQALLSLRTEKLINEAASKMLRNDAFDREETISALLTLEPNFDIQQIIDLGASLDLYLGNVATIRIVPSNLEQLASIKGIKFIQAENKVRKVLNIAAQSIEADKAFAAEGDLRKSFTGKNTVVGIVDFGFDYTHPTFYDLHGNTRIIAAWNQNDNTGSTTGIQRTYGTVYYTQAELERKQCSDKNESHGTHVAGIAAGNGGMHTDYKGIAPEANIVLVQLKSGTDAEVLDAVDFIFALAQSMGMPAVVNLSLGSHWGPHDGSSPFDVSIDKLVGKGKIVVGAAGNEGNLNLHTAYTFTERNNTVRSIIEPEIQNTSTMVWGNENSTLDWNVEVWDKVNNTKLHTASNSFLSTQLAQKINSSFTHNGITIRYNANSYNAYAEVKRGIIEIEISNPSPTKYGLALVLKANDGTTTHWWNLGSDIENYGTFSALNATSNTWISGNNAVTIGEVGSTAKSIISVGASISKQNYTSLTEKNQTYLGAGILNGMANFSSHGPTADQRNKPDVVAAGSLVVAAVNSCDTSYNASSNTTILQQTKNAKNHYMAIMQGTSMAAPMVAGAIALLLESCPNLTPDSIRNILQRTAKLEGLIANESANTRGAGLVNIHKALLQKQNIICDSIEPIPLSTSKGETWNEYIDFSIYPNPNNGEFFIKSDNYKGETFILNIYNTVGIRLFTQEITTEQRIYLPLPRGVYIVQLQNKKLKGAKKMLIYN
ncbi:MAG: S8 family serine peptidase [Bacteroidales bacterium]